MPCYDSRDEELAKQVASRLNAATSAACAALKELDEQGIPIPPEAAAWWQEHKVVDAARNK